MFFVDFDLAARPQFTHQLIGRRQKITDKAAQPPAVQLALQLIADGVAFLAFQQAFQPGAYRRGGFIAGGAPRTGGIILRRSDE